MAKLGLGHLFAVPFPWNSVAKVRRGDWKVNPGTRGFAGLVGVRYLKQMFRNGLKGARIASFPLPWAPWQVASLAISVSIIAYFFLWLIEGKSAAAFPTALVLIACPAASVARQGRIQFYETGLSVPKAAGEIFLSREQLLEVRLDGDGFMVTGSDASWDGPYSGGVFCIRKKDLVAFREVLARFSTSVTR